MESGVAVARKNIRLSAENEFSKSNNDWFMQEGTTE